MDDRAWALFAAEVEASFRGDLAEDRELALREHLGEATLDEARAAVHRLVRAGHVMQPAPAEVLGALRDERRERRAAALPKGGDGMRPGSAWRSHQQVIDDRRRTRTIDADEDAYERGDCAGMFRVEADNGRSPAELECDACGELLTVPQQHLGAPAAAGAGTFQSADPDPLEPKDEL